jgi:hypothetical protein
MGLGTQYTGFWLGNTRNLAIDGALSRRNRRASPVRYRGLKITLYPPLHKFPRSIRILPHCCDSVRNAKRCCVTVVTAFDGVLILEPHVVADFGLYWFRRGATE